MKSCKNSEPGTPHAKRPIKKAGRCATCERDFRKSQRDRARANRVEKTYGLSVEDSEAVMEEQGGVCAICRKPFVRKDGSWDHDHKREHLGMRASVRGKIHGWENTILGRVGDNPEHLRAMADYLESPPARRVLGD